MLADLAIENLGVIPKANIELSPGLTVLTGETGAGKTMVVTGLRLLSGARADASRVRTGAKSATVEGRFITDELGPEQQQLAHSIVSEAGGQADENGEVIASRTVQANGRSKAYLGGRGVPAATLHDFSETVLTIHGQNDQLRLLAPERQLEALDRFDPAIGLLRENYLEVYREWKSLDKQLRERVEKRRELAQEVDRLQFAVEEIDAIAPEEGEDESLVADIRRLQDVDTLREQATTALVAIDGAEDDMEGSSASDLLGAAGSALLQSDDPALQQLAEQLVALTSELSDVSRELGAFLSDLPTDPEALDSMLQRQQQLKSLTRKYAPDIAGVLQWRDKAQQRLNSIDVSPDALEKLRSQAAEAEKNMMRAARALSKARVKAAQELAEAVTNEIHGLAMPKSRFEVSLSTSNPRPTGIDEAEFQLAGAPELEARPLATSASGGELSRVMLALEVILSAGSSGETLVFDEVDAGVGGRAAVEIGRRLARLAKHNQVIVVTHLPQVAAYADTHLHVLKSVSDQASTSGVEELDGDRRVEELARMLAGLDDTDTGRAHAKELLERAQADRAAG
ncbi:DNA repair protein RecN [Corynebacterium epidermidicanis]|uniref:DNA repair protein RecN n=1 Tax=Corynebacterium epidermidicanis TaxID=1050174 RepID=A0A0G3GP98_9CORY|nr:DNA repair protein RecN [Corynebacterium epidermidicanis]AKK03051.1 DNA replication and repair protein RecN [Corynebacterium epidermidicanis]